MPFGLHNSPATWQRLIDEVLGADVEVYVFVYLDDIIICTPDFATHLRVMKLILSRLQKAGLTLNREKCKFCCPQLKYLGYVVDYYGLRVDPEKISAIVDYPAPKTTKQLRRFLGMASWYRRFVSDFSTITAPLTALLKKGRQWSWSEECMQAFKLLKEQLISAPVLTCPDFEKPFILQTDASEVGLGAILSQEFPEGERVIAFASRSLTKLERKYCATELEALAVLWAIEKFRSYLEGQKFCVVTDHMALKWIMTLKEPKGRLARWVLRLQQYDFEIIHRPGKLNVAADALSRAPVNAVDIQPAENNDKWYRGMLEKVLANPDSYPLWCVECDTLYANRSRKKKTEEESEWKIVVPKSQRKKLIHYNHDEPMAGHLGIFKTKRRIMARYYWPGMASDITNYVRKCAVCLSTKSDSKKPAGLMGTQREAGSPWRMISADLMGPFPRSSKGNCYLLVVVDCFTKYALLHPLRKADAKAVARYIEEEVFMIFGVPQYLIADNGPQFRSKEFQSLMESYKVRILFNPLYHAQSNPTERYNRTIKAMISAYIKENHKQWDKHLPQLGFALRSAINEFTGYSPSYLTFGRPLHPSGERLPSNYDPLITPSEPEKNKSNDHVHKLRRVVENVKNQLRLVHEKNAATYNLRRRHEEFKIGDFVWKKTHFLSDASKDFSAKLAPKYIRCRISAKITPLVYELQDEKDKTIGRWHVSELKREPE